METHSPPIDPRRPSASAAPRPILFCLLLACPAGALLAAAPSTQRDLAMINLKDVVATNIPNLDKCIGKDGLVFQAADAAPADGNCFFLRYRFEIPSAGRYCLAIQGKAPGSIGYSRYSYVLDDGPPREALCRRRVTPTNGIGQGWNEQPPVELAAGPHQIEFRFAPDQRVRKMNRVREPYAGHRVEMKAVTFRPAAVATTAPAAGAAARVLADGQTIVLFGDSITDEGFYAAHLARLLEAWRPGAAITCYNAGISLNRTWEGLERLDRDVLALRPDWVVLALGVNDAVHMAPDEFARNYEQLVTRLQEANIGVICATPTGMLPSLAPKEKTYFHAPDRAVGFDRTMAYEAGAIAAISAKRHCPCADLLAVFQAAGPRRAELMANQWHPNTEGGRWMAAAMLHALGWTPADAERSGDPNDAQCLREILALPKAQWPVYAPPAAQPAAATGRLIAASSFSRNEVDVFGEDGRAVARLGVGHHPMGMAFSAKRNRLYVTCEGSGTVEVFSVPDFQRQQPISLGDVYPVSIVLDANEDTAWTGNFFGSNVSEIDLATGQVRRQIPVGSLVEGVMLLPEHNCLLAATRQGLKLVDLAKGEVVKTLLITDHCDGLYRSAEGQVFAIDTVSWKITPLALPALEAGQAQPCPIPSRALAVDSTGGLWAADAFRSRILRRRAGAEAFHAVAEVECPLGLVVLETPSR